MTSRDWHTPHDRMTAWRTLRMAMAIGGHCVAPRCSAHPRSLSSARGATDLGVPLGRSPRRGGWPRRAEIRRRLGQSPPQGDGRPSDARAPAQPRPGALRRCVLPVMARALGLDAVGRRFDGGSCRAHVGGQAPVRVAVTRENDSPLARCQPLGTDDVSAARPNEFQLSAYSAQIRSIRGRCAPRVNGGRGLWTGAGLT
jgi:hypothetical protein